MKNSHVEYRLYVERGIEMFGTGYHLYPQTCKEGMKKLDSLLRQSSAQHPIYATLAKSVNYGTWDMIARMDSPTGQIAVFK
jgi:hypothetical protein